MQRGWACRRACLVAQLCPTLCDPMDCSPPGSSVLGDSSGKNTGVGHLSLLQLGCAARHQLCKLPCVRGMTASSSQPRSQPRHSVSSACTAPTPLACGVLLVRKFLKLMVSSQKREEFPKCFLKVARVIATAMSSIQFSFLEF